MIPAVGVAVVATTTALTLRSDSKPVRIAVNKPRGTVYWGGAGLNGPYIADQVAALQEIGIKRVWIGKRSYGDLPDALRSWAELRFERRSDDRYWMVEGMEKVPADQFNLIGYSYGSLMAAQTAHVYASNGHIVDHLVLIASPIDANFLLNLQRNKNIKRVIIIDLRQFNDPIFAGMSGWRLTFAAWTLKQQDNESGDSKGVGHFYYRPASEEGKKRRRQLARYLFEQGLR